MPLTDTFVRQVKSTGKATGDKHADGGGLYLLVKPQSKYWRLDYRYAEKRKTLSLGVYPEVSLAQARKRREDARQLLAQDMDPGLVKKAQKVALAASSENSFEAVAREFFEVKKDGWSERYAEKWLRIMAKDLFPQIGRMLLPQITAPFLLAVLRKVEKRGARDTAHTLLQQAGKVFRYGVQTGRCERDPSADLRGALEPVVVKHMAAILEPARVSELLRAFDSYTGQPTTAAALKLSALLFQRPGNIRQMEWAWVDFDHAMLTIPAASMKRTKHGKLNGRPHFVPLAPQAVEILQELWPLTGHGQYVFSSLRTASRPMSENTVNAALRRLDFTGDEMTAHGFRAMARTLMVEHLPGIDPEVIEAQLAHGKSGPLGAAYDRAEYMTQRRQIMVTWATYLDRLRDGAEVIALRA
ncbi:integrase arm-type DNA-binding domain-containing protein [Comamonadaceae bacterium PP-2]